MNRAIILFCATLALSACTGTAGLSPAMTARMDVQGAQLDRTAAIGIINQFRASRSVSPLIADAELDAAAQTLAAQYAKSGKTPTRPAIAGIILTSAGYATLADTFSGWRSGPADANTLADAAQTRAGIGVAYTPNSNFGVHWVMLLAPSPTPAVQ